MYQQDNDDGYWVPNNISYYGEVEFTMFYKNEKSFLFGWLYLDFKTLINAAEANNFDCNLVSEGNHYDYLARLMLKS